MRYAPFPLHWLQYSEISRTILVTPNLGFTSNLLVSSVINKIHARRPLKGILHITLLISTSFKYTRNSKTSERRGFRARPFLCLVECYRKICLSGILNQKVCCIIFCATCILTQMFIRKCGPLWSWNILESVSKHAAQNRRLNQD